MRHFIIRKCAFFSNEIKNHFLANIVTDTTANQLNIPHHSSYVWPALEKEIPLALNPVHFFLLESSPNPFLVKDINHRFEQEVKETLLFLSQCHSILPFIALFH